jgi:hypothetical protein
VRFNPDLRDSDATIRSARMARPVAHPATAASRGMLVLVKPPVEAVGNGTDGLLASVAASGGSLPMIGKLLGHNHPLTTARYAQLADDPA